MSFALAVVLANAHVQGLSGARNTAVANVASHRVLEKNRFTRVGLLRSHLLLGGVWTDHYLWELIDGD